MKFIRETVFKMLRFRGVFRINTVYFGSSVRVCVSDFQIKGKHLLPVNFGTGLVLQGVYILYS